MEKLERQNFLNKDILYLKNVSITEWDMHSAVLSIMKQHKLIPENIAEELSKLPKLDRNIRIGKLQIGNDKLKDEINKLLKEYIRTFAKINKIDLGNILSIKKDALFIVNQYPTQTKFGEIEFVAKHTYTSYIYLNKKEFYYNSLLNEIDVKGINDELIEKCHGIISDIKSLLNKSESLPIEDFFKVIQKYRSDYLNRKLPIESYRSLATGLFKTNSRREFEFDQLDDNDENKKILNISDNYIGYILPLIQQIL